MKPIASASHFSHVRRRFRRIAATLGVGATVIVAGTFVGPRDPVGAHGVPERLNEPIIVAGADVPEFGGAPGAQLWAFAFDHGSWERVPLQMDERDDQDLIVGGEDGMLDANDEIVFTSELIGERRGEGDWPPGIGREHAAAEVMLTDPLHTDWEGCVYLFWSATGPEPALAPAVTWDAAMHQLNSSSYALGFADPDTDGFSGLKSLRLFTGAPDILDRLKVRVTLSVLGIKQHLDEESDNTGLPVPEAVTSGPVRVVLDPSGEMVAYARRVRLGSGLGDFDPSVPGVITVDNVLVAMDFLPSAGTGTYKDANTAAGVTIDGMPDTVMETPWPVWRSIEFADGKLVMLHQEYANISNTYVDGTFEQDTGDGIAYGQNGIVTDDLDAFREASFPGELVMVGPGQSFEGVDLFHQSQSPLVVEVTVGAAPTPGAETATATDQPGPTNTWTPRPNTATTTPTNESRYHLFLPRVLGHG